LNENSIEVLNVTW